MTSVVVVTGPVGVGKTAVTWEMAEVLDERGLAFMRFDADAVHYRPHAPDDRFGERVTLEVLEYTWKLVRAERVILPKVVETRAWIDRYRAVIPDAEVRFLDTGHFALETHATEIGAAMREFLGKHIANG